MRKSIGHQGFTLIELVMVIAIIGLLAAIALPKFVDLQVEAKKAATKGALGALRSVLAIRYAASATGGAAASFPGSISGTDFHDGKEITNKVSGKDSVVTTSGVPGSTDTNAKGFWYISSGVSAGQAGAFSDGTVPTNDF